MFGELNWIQGLYSSTIEIWTAPKMTKTMDTLGQFNKFPAQATRNLTDKIRDRFLQISFMKKTVQILSSSHNIVVPLMNI